jgi:hypothetical protein
MHTAAPTIPLTTPPAQLQPTQVLPALPVGTKLEDLLKPTGDLEDPTYVHLGNLRIERDLFDDFKAAQQHLGKDPEAVKLLHALETAPDQHTIHKITDANDQYAPDEKYDAHGKLLPSSGTIDWNPHVALQSMGGGRISPALALLHEQGHAYQHQTDAAGYYQNVVVDKNTRYTTAEEQRNISGLEDRAARILGEAVRTDHGGMVYNVANPASTVPTDPKIALTPEQTRAGIQQGIDTLKFFGYPTPPNVSADANAVQAWDGKAHVGTFVQIDPHTVAQHIGRGHYQTYDIDRDLHGHVPSEVQPLDVSAHGILTDPHAQTQTHAASGVTR